MIPEAYLKKERGKPLLIDRHLLVYATSDLSRANTALLVSLPLLLLIALGAAHFLLGLFAACLATALIYPLVVVRHFTAESKGITEELRLLDFVIRSKRIPIQDYKEAIPVKYNRRENINYTVEVLHDNGVLTIPAFVDLESCKQVVKCLEDLKQAYRDSEEKVT